jgi:hypothetical protein
MASNKAKNSMLEACSSKWYPCNHRDNSKWDSNLFGLIPKIPCVFLPKFVVFDIVGKIIVPENLNVKS